MKIYDTVWEAFDDLMLEVSGSGVCLRVGDDKLLVTRGDTSPFRYIRDSAAHTPLGDAR